MAEEKKNSPASSGGGSKVGQLASAYSSANMGAQTQPLTFGFGDASAGGMRGIGLAVFLIAQMTLKLKSVDLSKDYYKSNKKDFDFFKATHQGAMTASVTEVMSATYNPSYTPDLYASAPAGASKSKIIDRQWFEARRRTHRYAVGAQARLDYDYSIQRTAGSLTGWNLGRRYEMAWSDAHNERAFNRKIAMANVGISAGNTIREGLATAVSKLNDAYSGLSSAVSSIGNGYFAKESYTQGRAETRVRYDKNSTEAKRAVGMEKN